MARSLTFTMWNEILVCYTLQCRDVPQENKVPVLKDSKEPYSKFRFKKESKARKRAWHKKKHAFV